MFNIRGEDVQDFIAMDRISRLRRRLGLTQIDGDLPWGLKRYICWERTGEIQFTLSFNKGQNFCDHGIQVNNRIDTFV